MLTFNCTELQVKIVPDIHLGDESGWPSSEFEPRIKRRTAQLGRGGSR